MSKMLVVSISLQQFQDELYKAGWSNPCDAQGEGIKKLYMKLFPKDYVIDHLMNTIEEYEKIFVEADEYLNTNKLTNITHGSLLHKKIHQAAHE